MGTLVAHSWLSNTEGSGDHRVERVLRVCRQVVSAFSCSWKRRRHLVEEQESKQLPKHRLRADVKTRWGSVLNMIDWILEQQKATRVVLASDRKAAHLVPTWQDTDVLDSVIHVAVLRPLRDFTDLLAGESEVTVSAILPLLTHIQENIVKHKRLTPVSQRRSRNGSVATWNLRKSMN